MFDVLASPEMAAAIGNILLGLIVGVVGLLSKSILSFIKSKVSTEQLAVITEVATIAVKAAEQGALAGLIDNKKTAAMAAASNFLADRGITIDPKALSDAIEAAVATEFNSYAINDASYRKTLGEPA